MKCNQPRQGFELVSPCPFPTTITITPRAPPYIYIYMKSFWVSGRWPSSMVSTNLFRSTRARTFPAMKISLIPWYLEQSDFSPLFLYKMTMISSRRSLGNLPYSHQQTKSSWNLLYNVGFPSFQSSGGIPSTPAAFPLLNSSMALVIFFIESSSSNSAWNGCWGMQSIYDSRKIV